ncbi:hypothetical protein AAY473_036422, partial [Plecturocebus cupreus]
MAEAAKESLGLVYSLTHSYQEKPVNEKQLWRTGDQGFNGLDSWTYTSGLQALRPQTEGSTVSFPTFEVLGHVLASLLLSLHTAYCGTSACDH